MIIAIGVDQAEIARMSRAVDHPKWGQRFRRRVFTAAEIAYCESRKRHSESFAARFAAKEAVMKALGTGMSGVGWCEIEVVREGEEAPVVRLSGAAARRAAELGIERWHVALTHSGDSATAFVVAEGTRHPD